VFTVGGAAVTLATPSGCPISPPSTPAVRVSPSSVAEIAEFFLVTDRSSPCSPPSLQPSSDLAVFSVELRVSSRS